MKYILQNIWLPAMARSELSFKLSSLWYYHWEASWTHGVHCYGRRTCRKEALAERFLF